MSAEDKRSSFSLTLIYQALQNPNSSSNLKCRTDLHAASVKQLDYTLRTLKSYTKRSDWTSKRLIACLDYIFTHGIKPSSEIQSIIQLPSFKVCIRWSLSAVTEDSIFCASKFFCNVLETVVSKLPESASTMVSDIRHHGGVKHFLDWTQHENQGVRNYSIRILFTNLSFFTKDLIALNAHVRLSQGLNEIPDLICKLILQPPISDAPQKRIELEHCILTCKLLECIFKYQDRNSKTLVVFAESKLFSTLVKVWQFTCHHEYTVLTNRVSRFEVKNEKSLVYSLTSIIQKLVSCSKRAATTVVKRPEWETYLVLLLQRRIHTTLDIKISKDACLEKRTLKKLLGISLDLAPALMAEADKVTCYLTNFLMAYVSQPILPEHVETISQYKLLHTNLCIDVEERGFTITSDMLEEDRDLLSTILSVFIQYVQLASKECVEQISGRVAWTLKSLLAILVNTNQLQTTGLQPRIQRLIVFFLHYKDAIDTLATCTTSITPLIWGSTIEQAKLGLATALTIEGELNESQNSIITKAKKAFLSLELISTHPRACERLMDSNVLQLVDISYIPKGDQMEKTISLLTMYALYGRFIAALSKRTAYVRTRLRDECGLFPMILKLLQEAIEYKELKKEEDPLRLGWTKVICSCLLVVSSFKYDETSMRMWLSWSLVNDVNKEQEGYDVPQPSTPRDTTSILPSLLSLLFPWRQQNLDISKVLKLTDYYEVIILAAEVLEQLSGIPLCGRQMIADETSLSNLSALMVALTKDCIHETNVESNEDSDTEMTCANKPVEETVVQDNTKNKLKESELINYQCAEYLGKSAVRILISNDNIQYIILNDAFTKFFKSMLSHPSHLTSHEHWRISICKDLYTKKIQDFINLYKFTQETDRAIKLFEFTAVAIGYALIGTSNYQEWNSILGFTLLEGNIVSSKYVFGVLCQMLVFELEYEDEEQAMDSVLTLITPFRRNAAAQVIEILGLELEVLWQIETDSIRETHFLPDLISLESPQEIVYFSTDDSSQLISGNRQLLRARSPVFEALLGSNYAEESKLNTATAISLHDVSYDSLKLFVSVIHKLNEGTENVLDTLISSWSNIVDLLLISDRFGSHVVKTNCEHWVLEKIKHLNSIGDEERLVCLEGLLCLYRHCRDPMEYDGGIRSQSWPFAILVRESLKAIVQYLSSSCQTKEFVKMVFDNDIEELNSFCDGMASLLKK